MPAATLAPIMTSDLVDVSRFLHVHLNSRVRPATWYRGLRRQWPVDQPNHGFHLRLEDGTVVGVLLAFYSDRPGSMDDPVRWCNIGAWCVLEDYRAQGLRLMRAVLGQRGWSFTDLSPSGSVVALDERLGFEHLDTTAALVPNLPRPTWPGRATVSCDPDTIEASLAGVDLQIYLDHRDAPAARHLVARLGDTTCHVMWRRDRRKDLPLFSQLLHLSDPSCYRRASVAIHRHLLLHHGVPLTLVERRIAGGRPSLSWRMERTRPKMARSSTVPTDSADYLYSELTVVPW